MRYWVVALVLAFASACGGQELTMSILPRLEAQNSHLASLTANVEVRTDARSGEAAVSSGIIHARRGKKHPLFNLSLIESHDDLSINGSQFVWIQPSKHRALKGPTTPGIFWPLLLLDFSTARLKAMSDTASYIGEEDVGGGVMTWHLRFESKTSADFRYWDGWFDIDGMVRRIVVDQRDGSKVSVTLTDILKNKPIRKGDLRPPIPRGFKILRISSYPNRSFYDSNMAPAPVRSQTIPSICHPQGREPAHPHFALS